MPLTGNVTAVLDGAAAAALGKKGTSSDVTLYNHKQGDAILSFVHPSAYPEKVQSLVSALTMADQILLNVGVLNAGVAETIVALDAADARIGYLVLAGEMTHDSLKAAAAASVVSSYPLLEWQPALVREKLAELAFGAGGETLVLVDHSFAVKGVGTVALGVVKQGVVRKHDPITLYPSRIKTLVKSIQVHDKDVAEAQAGVRVGLALKDARPEDVPRGTVISSSDSLETASGVEADVALSKYSPRTLNPGDVFLAAHLLTYTPARVLEGSVNPGQKGRLKLQLEKEITLTPGRLMLLDPSQKMPRILGGGRL